MVKFVIWTSICILLVGCGAPILRSDEALFGSEPEVMESLRPYLDEWAITSPEQTQDQRNEMTAQLGLMAIALMPTDRISQDGNPIYVVDIMLEAWGDWYRGLFYVIDGIEVAGNDHLTVRRLDENWFAYNRTE